MAEPMPAAIGVGTVVAGSYEIVRLVGRGGMGAVWEAKHVRLPGKRAAVKVLLGEAAGESFLRFRREAEIASRLGHPHIVEVIDFNLLPGGAPYLVLEFLEGESLASRLRRGILPAREALEIARQIGSALAAAHGAGVVHRDLKPENVFLCPDPSTDLGIRVKVLDFGISKIQGSETVRTQDAVLMGTPQYMSPEQAAGRNSEIDARTDVFALGAIVYEMLSGGPPFVADTIAQVVFKIVYEPAPPLASKVPAVTPAVAAAVDRALAKDRDARFADVGAFVAALTGRPLRTVDREPATPAPSLALEPTLASAPLPPAVPQARRWGRLVGAGALIVVVGAAAFAMRRPELVPTPAPVVSASPRPGPEAVAAPSPVGSPEPARPRPRVGAPESVSAEQAVDLAEAEKILAGGQADEAIRLARKTLYAGKSTRAFAVITRAFCKKGDLGNARANAASVKGSERVKVLADCRAAGVELPR